MLDNQISLPFETSEQKTKGYAQQHFNITFGKQKRISVLAKKIMIHTLSLVDRKANKIEPLYRFHVNELQHGYKDLKSFKKELKIAYRQLVETSWHIADIKGNKWAFYNILNTTIRNIGYDNGYLVVAFNPLLEPYFIELSRYTTLQLKWFMSLQSWYSMRVMECLSSYKDTGKWYVSLLEFRKLMDCEKKLKATGNFINKTVIHAQNELKNTPFAFEFEKIFEKKTNGNGRPKLIGLEFTLLKKRIKEIPLNWLQNPKHSELLQKLLKKWYVDERHIINYANVLTPLRIENLIKIWEEKERSNNRIDNKQLYCNSAFVNEAKKHI